MSRWSHLGITITDEMGIGAKVINKTGAPSKYGTVVKPCSVCENGFEITELGSNIATWIVYDDGIPDGDECLVVGHGIADVLLEDWTVSAYGNWVQASDNQAGRADATAINPPVGLVHIEKQIGICMQTKSAGVDVLCRVKIKFR